jgi:polysaccharide deacetylase family protein (PEP-CTERM system associated)
MVDIVNSITVDVEDYFHTQALSDSIAQHEWSELPSRVEQNTKRIFDIFAAHGVRGTFFFLGWVAERFPGLVREAARLGHEIACHSYWHRVVYKLTPQEFEKDTKRAKQAIEDAAGLPVFGYRAPNFSLIRGTEWAAEILATLGFHYDSSVYPIRHFIYGNSEAKRMPNQIAGGRLLEFPLATLAVGRFNLPVGGGAYLRILPYYYTHAALSRCMAEPIPVVLYIHPWEFDAEQPRVRAGAMSRFRQYTGLEFMEAKLHKVLTNFHFLPINEAFSKELAGFSKTPFEDRAAERTVSPPLAS